MNRPSYWMLLFLVTAGIVLFAFEMAVPGLSITTPAHAAPVRVSLDHGNRSPRPDAEPESVLPGRIFDARGRALDGVRVQSMNGRGAAITDREGRFELPVEGRGPHRLQIWAAGYEPLQSLVSCASEPFVAALRSELPWPVQAPVKGDTVGLLAGEGFLRTEDGLPSTHAVVTVVETGALASADHAGRYTIALPGESVVLVAHDAEGRVAESAPFASARKQGLVPLPELVLRPGSTLRGLVKESAGAPCAGAGLVLTGPQGVRRALTTSSGLFVLNGLMVGDYTLEALPYEGSLGVRRPIHITQSTMDLEIALEIEQPLTVEVRSKGDATQALVHVVANEGDLRRACAQADETGTAVLHGLGHGPFTFEVRQPNSFASLAVIEWQPATHRLVVDVD